MELQQFSSWWEKLLYCPRYEKQRPQIVRRRQRARTQGKGLFVRRSKFNSATANKLERSTKFLVPLTATLFFWFKFTCDNLPYWQCPRFAVNLSPPKRAGEDGGVYYRGRRKIVLDMCITILYTWDKVKGSRRTVSWKWPLGKLKRYILPIKALRDFKKKGGMYARIKNKDSPRQWRLAKEQRSQFQGTYIIWRTKRYDGHKKIQRAISERVWSP